jgi:outer membrane protein TolC
LRSTTLSPEAVVSVRLRISYRERFSAFLVVQAQQDLLVSQIAEVRALANYLKALIDLYRQDGLLLERRRVVAPGCEPVKLSENTTN